MANTIVKIQTLYNLNIASLSDGIIDDSQAHSYVSGDEEGAASMYEKVLNTSISFLPSDEFVEDYKQALGGCKNAAKWRAEMKEHVPLRFADKKHEDISDPVCMGDVLPQEDLSCHLVHHNKSYLRLSPFRLEELHEDTPVVLFHDIISNEEIKRIRNMATPLRSLALRNQNIVEVGGSHKLEHSRSPERPDTKECWGSRRTRGCDLTEAGTCQMLEHASVPSSLEFAKDKISPETTQAENLFLPEHKG
ncbi:hypothetical protein J6590_064676 [Homalodisca vitripennis]|nr:hypothetical protein J6590_064676 [Homalodisca vitripennis]